MIIDRICRSCEKHFKGGPREVAAATNSAGAAVNAQMPPWGAMEGKMKVEKLRRRIGTEYLGDDAKQDGAYIVYLDDDSAQNCYGAGADDFVVITDDAGAVLCLHDSEHTLIDVCTPCQLIGCEGFSDDFVAWVLHGASATTFFAQR